MDRLTLSQIEALFKKVSFETGKKLHDLAMVIAMGCANGSGNLKSSEFQKFLNQLVKVDTRAPKRDVKDSLRAIKLMSKNIDIEDN